MTLTALTSFIIVIILIVELYIGPLIQSRVTGQRAITVSRRSSGG